MKWSWGWKGAVAGSVVWVLYASGFWALGELARCYTGPFWIPLWRQTVVPGVIHSAASPGEALVNAFWGLLNPQSRDTDAGEDSRGEDAWILWPEVGYRISDLRPGVLEPFSSGTLCEDPETGRPDGGVWFRGPTLTYRTGRDWVLMRPGAHLVFVYILLLPGIVMAGVGFLLGLWAALVAHILGRRAKERKP